MEQFIIAVNVVFPLLICMALGYLLHRLHMLSDGTLSQLNKLVFRVFLPTLLFYNVYTTELAAAFDGGLLLFSVLCVLVLFVLLMLVIPQLEKDNRRRGVIIQGIFRSNFAIFGIPIVQSLFGNEGVGITSIVVAVVVPLFNALSVIVLEYYREGKANPKKILFGILQNPIIIGSALGLLFLSLHIPLPVFITKAVSSVAGVTTPLALIVLGGSFQFSQVQGCLRPLIITVLGRLVVTPLLFLPVGILFGLQGAPLACFACMLSAPTAVSTYTMAKQMDADGDLANQVVVFTALFSILTIFLIVFALKLAGLI